MHPQHPYQPQPQPGTPHPVGGAVHQPAASTQPTATAQPAATPQAGVAQVATATDAPEPDASGSIASLRLAALALLLCAGGFVAMSELGIGRTGSGTAVEAGAIGVIASDLVTASKQDSGASDAIGGYLPGVGIVLTVHIDELASSEMEGWVAGNLDPFADRLALLPDGEAVVVTLDIAQPSPMARVWSLQPEDLARTEGWERLVAPASFVDSERDLAAAAGESPPAELASATDDDAAANDAESAEAEDQESSPSADDDDAEDSADENADAEGDGAGMAEQDSGESETPIDGDGDGDSVDVDDGDSVDVGGGDGVDVDGGDGSGDGGLFADASLWSPIFGSWTLADGIYAQSDATGYGYSSEYIGETSDYFDVGVSMRAPFGDMNAGIIFGQPERGSKNGSTVIDITGEGTYLRWGEYDPDNGEWSFVGGAPIEPAIVADEWTSLDLEVRPDNTAINLNGEFVASIDSPPPGGIALVVSVANIEFTDFTLTPVDAEAPPPDDTEAEDEGEAADGEEVEVDGEVDAEGDGDEDVETADGSDLELADGADGFSGAGGSGIAFEVLDDELADWQLLSGSWTATDGVMSQNNGDGYDQMIHFLDEPETNYRVEVKARAGEDSRFSGGLLFNIDRTGVRQNSFVFDIVNDGTDVRWATYDSNGVFTYLGGVRIADGFDPEAWHLIAVEVRDGRAQFFIDGSEVGASRDVGSSGHVGMVTSLAAMDFTDFVVIPLDG